MFGELQALAATDNHSAGSSSSSGRCSLEPPASTPKIALIETKTNSATLYIEPASGQVTGYTVGYGFSPEEERFAVAFEQGYSSGMVKYKISDLDSNTQYYFRVKANNQCAYTGYSSSYLVKTPRFFWQKTEYHSDDMAQSRTSQPFIEVVPQESENMQDVLVEQDQNVVDTFDQIADIIPRSGNESDQKSQEESRPSLQPSVQNNESAATQTEKVNLLTRIWNSIIALFKSIF